MVMDRNHNLNCCECPPNVRTLQSATQLRKVNNSFAHVTSNNTTYFVDSNNEITIIFSGDVYVDGYNYIQNPLKLRSQTCYDFLNNRAIHYNAAGDYRITKLEKQ